MTLVSHDTAQKLKNISSDETLSIRLKTNNLFNADYISLETIELINNNELSFSSWKDTHGTLFEAIKFEKLLISLMLFLIVAVASILVLSTVMMTVKSKEREVGILLTLGASSKQIILIFFTQGLIVSLVGIIFGIIFGFLLTYNLTNIILFLETALERNLLEAYFINYFPYHINLFQIFIICITSFALSLISSLIPSIRAVRLNPVQILRHE
jgi:lipoprotein-releasing system permease protein